MTMSDATVGVVIVTYNSAPEIVPCLESLPPAGVDPARVIVVDNASRDDTVLLIRSQFPAATVIVNRENAYYAAACNLGIRAATGGLILLLNPDTALPPGAVSALRRVLDEHPGAAAVAPMLTGPDGKQQHSVRELPGLDTLWYDLTGLAFLFPHGRRFARWRMGYWDGLSARAVEQPMASCLLVRRSVFEQVGLFDESFPMFFNDVDWCRRVLAAGYTIRYTPDVRVGHIGGASVRRCRVRMIWMGHAAYWRYLRRLHRSRPLRTVLVWISAVPLVAAAVLRSLWWGPRGFSCSTRRAK